MNPFMKTDVSNRKSQIKAFYETKKEFLIERRRCTPYFVLEKVDTKDSTNEQENNFKSLSSPIPSSTIALQVMMKPSVFITKNR